MAETTVKTMVQAPSLVRLPNMMAPVRTCEPMVKTSCSTNMTLMIS